MRGRYELIERVDAGPVAETWRARDAQSGASVALKKLAPELASAKDVEARFLAIAESLRSPPHWDLVAVIDAGRVHGEPFLARGWVDGVSLRQLLEAVRRRGIGALPPPLALSLVLAVADVVDKLHGASQVHGHLVTRNLFVLANGAVKVTDAGLNRVIEAAILGQSAVATLWPSNETAPEQLGAGQADERTDVFGLGALLFELLTLSRPTERAADGSIIIPPAASKHIPPIFIPMIGRALQQDRSQRFLDVKSLVAELQLVASMGFALDASSVALIVTALAGEERMPLPPAVTELLARFALTPGPPPNARKLTGESYLVAVPTPPPLPAGTPLPPPRTKSGDLRAVSPSQAADGGAPRTKTGDMRTVSSTNLPPVPKRTTGPRSQLSATNLPAVPAGDGQGLNKTTGPRSRPSLTNAPPVALGLDADQSTRIKHGISALGEDESPPTSVHAAAPPLGADEPGPTRIHAAQPALGPTLGMPPGPTPAIIASPLASGPIPDSGLVPLGADEPAATRALPSVPATNTHAIPGRSPVRFVPFIVGLFALAATALFVFQTVRPVAQGAVDISSTPPGADVMVNGEMTEKVTPTKLMLRANQPHVIELSLPGRLPWTETVTPSTDAPVVIRAELKGPPTSRGSN